MLNCRCSAISEMEGTSGATWPSHGPNAGALLPPQGQMGPASRPSGDARSRAAFYGIWTLECACLASLQLLQAWPSLCLREKDLTSLGLSLLTCGDRFFVHAKSTYSLFTVCPVLFHTLGYSRKPHTVPPQMAVNTTVVGVVGR